jgi:hypothetical protein
MALDILSQLNTRDVATGFNSFLESLGLGSMNPSASSRMRQGVEVSPMDDILSLNGFDLDSLFRKIIPEPPPFESALTAATEAIPTLTTAQAGELIGSLGLTLKQQKTLQSLLESGSMIGSGELPGSMLQLLGKPGTTTVADLITQLSSVSSLISGLDHSKSLTIADILTSLMSLLGTNDSRYAIDRLRRSPKLSLIASESNSSWVQTSPLPVARLYNPFLSKHLLSGSSAEIDILTGQSGWVNEGNLYTSPTEGTSILYRFYIDHENRHFYTANKSERDTIIANPSLSHFIYEGASHRVFDPVSTQPTDGLIPVNRFMNKASGIHLFVASTAEQVALVLTGAWVNEGVAWYGV